MANPQQKVLRIGVIMDGKLVQEKLIKAGETVSVGESSKNTFVLPKTHLTRPEHHLFVAKGGRYFLQFTDLMKGKIGAGESVTALEKIKKDSSVEKLAEGAGYRLPLSEQDRGKVNIDNITVLFQFVQPPAPAAAKPAPMDFRPRLLNEEDTILFGFMALFTAIGAIFLLYVWTAEVQEITSIDQLDERWQKLIIPDQPPPPPVPDAAPIEAPADKPADKPVAKPSDKPAEKAEKPAESKAEAQARVTQSSALLSMLTTQGASTSGQARDLLADAGSAAANAINNASSVEIADAGSTLKKGDVGGKGDAKLGTDTKIGTGGPGSDVLGSAPQAQLSVSAEAGNTDSLESGDAQGVAKTVRKYSPQLKYCYETRLRANPNLSGRVEIEWAMVGGRVTSTSVFANTTGDNELADCIAKKIKNWTFDATAGGDVQWPFVFKQKS
jgi:hypothetical protein